MSEARHRAAFFRQSGWLMIANITGGVFMWAVHFLSKAIPPSEYGLFGVLLAVAMCIPAMPLQMVLTQQTAQGLATHRERELSAMVRMVWLGTFVLWLVVALVVACFQAKILQRWEFTNPAGLWIGLLVMLFSIWAPMFGGVLQGQQNFLWLGWSMMSNGIGRLAVAAVAVLAFSAGATGMMIGVLVGVICAVVIGVWHTRGLWLAKPLPFDWRTFLRQMIPLMFGFGAFQFLFTADTMFVKSYFNGDDSGFYVSAGTLSRALMWLVGPLATVMFPKIVHSAARAEKTDLMKLVLLGTAVLAALGAMGLWVLGPWVVRFVFQPSYVAVASALLPWYAWAMVPLSVANVLLNNLLARSYFKVVPALCVLAAGYGFALTRFHDSLVTVLKTLGVCNLLLLIICAWFTYAAKAQPKAQVSA